MKHSHLIFNVILPCLFLNHDLYGAFILPHAASKTYLQLQYETYDSTTEEMSTSIFCVHFLKSSQTERVWVRRSYDVSYDESQSKRVKFLWNRSQNQTRQRTPNQARLLLFANAIFSADEFQMNGIK